LSTPLVRIYHSFRYRLPEVIPNLYPLLESPLSCYYDSPRSARWLRPVRRARKVRTPYSAMSDNVRGGEICRIGPQKHTAPPGVRVKWWCKRPPAQAAMLAAGQPPSGARPNRDELLREGRLLVSLEFQVGCTEENREVLPRQIITSVKGREEALRGVNRKIHQTECGLSAGLGIF